MYPFDASLWVRNFDLGIKHLLLAFEVETFRDGNLILRIGWVLKVEHQLSCSCWCNLSVLMWFSARLLQPHGEAIETFLLNWDFNCSAGSSFHMPLLRWVEIFETWCLKRFSSVLETAYQHIKRGCLESLVISCWEGELWIHQALDLLHELGLVGHEPKTPARSNEIIQTFKAVFEY